MLERVDEGKVYRNKKTGDLYKVIGIATSTDTAEKRVVYHCIESVSKVWDRAYDEFLMKFEEPPEQGVTGMRYYCKNCGAEFSYLGDDYDAMIMMRGTILA